MFDAAFEQAEERRPVLRWLAKVTGGILVLLGMVKIAFALCDRNSVIATVSERIMEI